MYKGQRFSEQLQYLMLLVQIVVVGGCGVSSVECTQVAAMDNVIV